MQELLNGLRRAGWEIINPPELRIKKTLQSNNLILSLNYSRFECAHVFFYGDDIGVNVVVLDDLYNIQIRPPKYMGADVTDKIRR